MYNNDGKQVGVYPVQVFGDKKQVTTKILQGWL